ncbi:hypothetical protein Y032_0544g3230 [Ancylostoma ceylanicum]|uniref:Uncharacterized protein n=1 Tax=Ancylostoma ceylanicum TaxID=53326 RepID=A0A016WSW4_9BILA|nr:hypothetical protein Y032_0544g3230 [Ancylostoma ceylanicum]
MNIQSLSKRLRVLFYSVAAVESRRGLLDSPNWVYSLRILRPPPAAILQLESVYFFKKDYIYRTWKASSCFPHNKTRPDGVWVEN